MNNLFKYLGICILIIGLLILAIPTFTASLTNSILLIGLGVVILGYLTHIILGKRVE
jgi:uncharacterized membrane protein HdeD (DUF308 family)